MSEPSEQVRPEEGRKAEHTTPTPSSGLQTPSFEATVYAVPRTPTEPVKRVPLHFRVGLQTRLIVFSILLVLIPLVFAGYTLESRWTRFTREQLQARSLQTARMLASLGLNDFLADDRVHLLRLAQETKNQPGIHYVLLQAPDGKAIAWVGPREAMPIALTSSGPVSPHPEAAVRDIEYTDPASGEAVRVVDAAAPVINSDAGGACVGIVHVGVSLGDFTNLVRKTRLRLLAFAQIALALSIILAYLLARQVTHPIRSLVSAVMRAAKGDLHTRIKIQSTDEVGELAKNFNYMVEQILQNQRKVEELNRNLEKKVKKRTVELENSNNALKRAFQELKQAESQMILSEKMASLGQLVAGVAHEINTPTSAINAAADNLRHSMTGIGEQLQALSHVRIEPAAEERLHALLRRVTAFERIGVPVILESLRQKSELLEELFEDMGLGEQRELAFSLARFDLGDDVREMLESLSAEQQREVLPFLQNIATMCASIQDLHYSVEAIRKMVKALKAYSHLDQSEMTEVNVHEGIETTLIILHNQLKYGVDIERTYGDIPLTHGNPSELNQVWTNILVNAIQAMKGRGKIAIETGYADGWISIKFTDDGPGIPPNILGRIFDPFFSTKDKGEGTGLGLSISQQLVRRNRGKINVSSRPGSTCFEILLPVATEAEGT